MIRDEEREVKMGEKERSIVFDKVERGFGKANYKIGQLMLKLFSEIN